MAAAIVAENVSKKYRLARSGDERLPYRTFRDELVRWAKWPARYVRGRTTRTEDFWALQDVSFEVQPGEVVGIIGRNGAGKSTLLKIFSRITKPTSGRIRLRGRVGSLLEVGTGFHPELTGRENIYLSGAVLGMKRAEIRQKFDEIVAFAEVEKFLDLPAKRYSSGMYVRLAFAVAAHLEPEILLVDEVLAVGDAAFQKKCLGRMGEVAKGGRTVLFVSHNLGAMQSLCTRGIVLKSGGVAIDDVVDAAANYYLRAIENQAAYDLRLRKDRKGIGEIRLQRVVVSREGGEDGGKLISGSQATLEFVWDGHGAEVDLIFTIYDHIGVPIANFNSHRKSSLDQVGTIACGLRCLITELPLVPGQYRLNVQLSVGGLIQDHVEGAALFDVEDGVVFGRPTPAPNAPGKVCIAHQWVSTPGPTGDEKAITNGKIQHG